MKISSALKITDAIRGIKDQHCEKCGIEAKGFVYRKTLPVYYCRKCLRNEVGGNGRLVA